MKTRTAFAALLSAAPAARAAYLYTYYFALRADTD